MATEESSSTNTNQTIGSDFPSPDHVTFADLFNEGPQNISEAIFESLATFQTSLDVDANDVTPPAVSVCCQLQEEVQPNGQSINHTSLTSPSKQIFDLICMGSFEDSSKETNLEDSGNVSDFQQDNCTSDDSLEVDFSSSVPQQQQQQLLQEYQQLMEQHQQQQEKQQQQQTPHQQSFDAVSPVIYSDFSPSPGAPQRLLPQQLYACNSVQPVLAFPTPPQQQMPAYQDIQFLSHAAPKPRPPTLLPKPETTRHEIADQMKILQEPNTFNPAREVVPILPAPAGGEQLEVRPTDAEFVSKKKTRTSYSMKQIRALERIFLDTPYPDSENIETISVELEISEQKLRIWFQNKRARWRKRTKDNETSSNPVYLPPLSLAGKLRSQQMESLPPTSYSLTSRALMSLHHLSSADQNKENTESSYVSHPSSGVPSAATHHASDLVTPNAHLGMVSSSVKPGYSPYQQQFLSEQHRGGNYTNTVHHRMNTFSPLNSAPINSTRNLMMQNSYGGSPSDFYRSTSCSVPMTSTPHYAERNCYFYQRGQTPLPSYYDHHSQEQYGSYTPSFGFM